VSAIHQPVVDNRIHQDVKVFL